MSEMVRQCKARCHLKEPLATQDMSPHLLEELIIATIEALRNPTEAMLKAGARGSGEDSFDVARGAWRAMVETALHVG